MNHDERPSAPEPTGEHKQGKSVKDHVKTHSTWLRLVFMLIVCMLYGVTRIVVGAVVVLQFCLVLFTGQTNKRLQRLGLSLATYTYQIICYLTFNTEERPFPFDADWPDGPPANS